MVIAVALIVSALGLLALGAFGVCDAQSSAWSFPADAVSVIAPSERNPAQALTVSGEILSRASRVDYPSSQGSVVSELHLKPPSDVQCRELAISLSAEAKEVHRLSIVPRASNQCSLQQQQWFVLAGEAPELIPLPLGAAVGIVFEPSQEPVRVFRDLQMAQIRSLRLAGPVNPFGTLAKPQLVQELDVAGALRLGAVTVDPPLQPDIRRPSLGVVIQSDDYERVLLGKKEQRLRWLLQWPPSGSMWEILLPSAQLALGIMQWLQSSRLPPPVPPVPPVPPAPPAPAPPSSPRSSRGCDRYRRLLQRVRTLLRRHRRSAHDHEPERPT
jgi:hypothetical protein